MGRKSGSENPQLDAKAKQASKLAEIREALMEAGCDTLDKQATALEYTEARPGRCSTATKELVLRPMSSNAFFARQNFPQRRDEKSKSMSRGGVAACMGTRSFAFGCFAINFVPRPGRLRSMSRITFAPLGRDQRQVIGIRTESLFK
jgi:hypothetical protein